MNRIKQDKVSEWLIEHVMDIVGCDRKTAANHLEVEGWDVLKAIARGANKSAIETGALIDTQQICAMWAETSNPKPTITQQDLTHMFFGTLMFSALSDEFYASGVYDELMFLREISYIKETMQ